ncbi:MAG TPA: sialate O-acetylesterase, partial [Victivallales bacterium]|nr:sialate O-acetylesterase [Victivallales bacterium]
YMLFDSMISPLVPFAIKGVVWYQGENNTDKNNRDYASLMRDMIKDWRYRWGQGDFKFLYVQLANHNHPKDYQEDSRWARVREKQLEVLTENNTGMAVAIDVGEAKNIHPKNKKDVGERLALWVLFQETGSPKVYSGPIIRSSSIEKDKIRVSFDYTGSGLIFKGGKLECAVIAGEDRIFHPANAVIEGNTILLSSDKVKNPVAARYAWADNPEKANLYNKEGLPASPFRTDDWQ